MAGSDEAGARTASSSTQPPAADGQEAKSQRHVTPAAPRRLFGIRTAARQPSYSPILEPVLQSLRANHPKASTDLVERAFTKADECHKGQRRSSGDPYITHPVAVTTILADIGMPPSALAAALLHDTVEDTDYTIEELRSEFGEEIAYLVDGVTKLDKVEYGEAAKAETVRKMVVAMSRDIRVLVIKLADRLHNARTWRYVPPHKAEKKARETLEIYAPLAHRLGMNTMKWELEDRSFQVLYPDVYDQIEQIVAEKAPAREEYLRMVKKEVEDALKDTRVKATVSGRPKHFYSIYQKMMVRGRALDDIYDLIGVRILTESLRDCYASLGAMHARWAPVQGRFKDYIAMPKFNMYQSLHTTVIGPQGKPVEIQIRTVEMHHRAEIGVAAHWKYKQRGKPGSMDDMQWLRQLLDWQRETSDPGEFLDSLRYEIQASEVYVFTPAGDVIALPAGSTPVDFAYAVHTEVGHKTIGARVNDKLVGLDSELKSGDRVNIILNSVDGAGPNRDWLDFVKSPRARNKIRHWFSKEQRDSAIESGRVELAKALRKRGIPVQRMMSHESLKMLAQRLRLDDADALYEAIGQHKLDPMEVIREILSDQGGEQGAEEDVAEVTLPTKRTRSRRSQGASIMVDGAAGTWTKLSMCCAPVPGDEIMGFVTRGHGVSVHRVNCRNASALQSEPDRLVKVEWADEASEAGYVVKIVVKALDRSGLLADVTKVLSESHVDIQSAAMQTTANMRATLRFTFELADKQHLEAILKAVAKVKSVHEAKREEGPAA